MQIADNSQPSNVIPFKRVDAAPYIAALFTADGNLKLAAERLSMSAEDVISAIASDPNAQSLFDSHLRVYASLKAFEVLGIAAQTVKATTHNMEPFQAGRHLTSLLTVIESMTRRAPQHTNINLFEAAMKEMPPEVVEALKLLKQPDVLTDDDIAHKVLHYDDISRDSDD